MDFDIGNILYIVITIVAVAVGLLGKKKKPAEGGSGAPKGNARPGFMENLERVLQMGQEQAGTMLARLALIAIAGCRSGINSGRSSAAVGQAATEAVVTSIVYLIIADAAINIIFQQIGI